jgi:hypothetical protein
MFLVSIMHVSLVYPSSDFSQYCMRLCFVHCVSCLNTACVFGLSIMCLVSIMHVSLVSPLYVLPQYCLCLVCPLCVFSQYCMCLWFVHFRYCLNTACVSGLSILCLASIMLVSLVCSFSVPCLNACLCLWFVHYVSGLSNACVSAFSILSVLSQYCPCLWFVNSLCLV